MRKLEVLNLINEKWSQLHQAVGSIPNYIMDSPGTEGLWSTTDTLKHVAGWDEEVIEIVRTYIESGMKKEDAGAGQINDRLLKDRKDMDADHAWTHFQATHQSLISYLKSLPKHVFDSESYTGYWIGCLVPQHYKDHTQDLGTIIASL
ncbi:MAG: Protein of unknown function (DUF1706) [Chloroflexi bacterium]|jgi:hypothetical protein|nr:MAG: Protein of unknown function (DUF1706) [Chloroflexota bacterium]